MGWDETETMAGDILRTFCYKSSTYIHRHVLVRVIHPPYLRSFSIDRRADMQTRSHARLSLFFSLFQFGSLFLAIVLPSFFPFTISCIRSHPILCDPIPSSFSFCPSHPIPSYSAFFLSIPFLSLARRLRLLNLIHSNPYHPLFLSHLDLEFSPDLTFPSSPLPHFPSHPIYPILSYSTLSHPIPSQTIHSQTIHSHPILPYLIPK